MEKFMTGLPIKHKKLAAQDETRPGNTWRNPKLKN